ncbi:hypothetical protein ACL02T_16790 [Pseudonocardia sp. RS010]|uniref:hypothetical protein n=1 Tax=Pseudonocardia sp. RS010 TaxID=3385979 RepID=UPI00399FB926
MPPEPAPGPRVDRRGGAGSADRVASPDGGTALTAANGRRATAAVRALAGLELLIAAAAIYGGVGLAAGNLIGMPDDWLAGTPFTSWLWPGVFLLLVVAVPMVAAAVLELRHDRRAVVASVLAGAAQVGWIAVQLLVMQRYHVLQPVMSLAGLAVLVLAVAIHCRLPKGS